jgi:nucleotide-binding universal stress UspA family protein
MYSFKTIVHPTDFSSHCAEAFKAAQSLAKVMNSKLVVVHVVNPPAVVSPDGQTITDPESGEKKDVWTEFDTIEKDPAVSFEKRLIVADKSASPKSLLKLTEGVECDLIVIGTHGYSGLKRLFLGSTAEEIVREAPCPVMVVKAKEQDSEEPAQASEEE